MRSWMWCVLGMLVGAGLVRGEKTIFDMDDLPPGGQVVPQKTGGGQEGNRGPAPVHQRPGPPGGLGPVSRPPTTPRTGPTTREVKILKSTEVAAAREGAKTYAQKMALLSSLGQAVTKAMGAEDYAEAKALVDAGGPIEKSLGNAWETRNWSQVGQSVREAEAAWNETKKDGSEAEKKLKLGRYLCFHRGQWKEGLADLAAGSDTKLAELAKRDMAGVHTADAEMGLGDAWWVVGEEVGGSAKKKIQRHAAGFYKASLWGLAAEPRQRVMDRLGIAGMAVMEVPDFVVEYLDQITADLPAKDAAEALKQKLPGLQDSARTALEVNGQARKVRYLARMRSLTVEQDPKEGPVANAMVGPHFMFLGIPVDFLANCKIPVPEGRDDPKFVDLSFRSQAREVFVVEGELTGFKLFMFYSRVPQIQGLRLSILPVVKEGTKLTLSTKD